MRQMVPEAPPCHNNFCQAPLGDQGTSTDLPGHFRAFAAKPSARMCRGCTDQAAQPPVVGCVTDDCMICPMSAPGAEGIDLGTKAGGWTQCAQQLLQKGPCSPVCWLKLMQLQMKLRIPLHTPATLPEKM